LGKNGNIDGQSNMARKIKIVTQNCFLGLPFWKVKRLMRETQADVVCLQEVTSQWFVKKVNKLSKHEVVITKPERALAVLAMRNATLSRLPLWTSGELKYERLTRKRKNPLAGQVLWADVKSGKTLVRIYNCHMAVFGIGMEDRAEMLSDIAKHAKKFTGPVVICGDMNTMMPERRPAWWVAKIWGRFPNPSSEVSDYQHLGEKYYFKDMALKHGFTEMGNIDRQTWRMPFLRWGFWQPKLDWMMYKGLSPVDYKLGPWIGDHRGVIATLEV